MKKAGITAILIAAIVGAACAIPVSALSYENYMFREETHKFNGETFTYVRADTTSMFVSSDGGIHIVAVKDNARSDRGELYDVWQYDLGADGKAQETDRLGYYKYGIETDPNFFEEFYLGTEKCTEEEFDSKFDKYSSMTEIDLGKGMFEDEKSIESNEQIIKVGDECILPTPLITKKNSALSISWECSDTSVVKISPDGTAQGLKSGIVTVTATVDGIESPLCSYTINVKTEDEIN